MADTRSSNNTAMDWNISSKFGTQIDFDLLKWVSSPNLQLEVDLQWHGRHHEISIWRHNCAFGWPIWMIFWNKTVKRRWSPSVLSKFSEVQSKHHWEPSRENATPLTFYGGRVLNHQLENVAIAKTLQLEAARAKPVLSRFKLQDHAKFEVAEPIHCHIIAFLLLTHYFTLWLWP